MSWKHFVDYDLRDGDLSFGTQPDFENGHPFDIHHGLVVRFALPQRRLYDSDEILEWFREEFGGDLESIRGGWTVGWDGSNTIGEYSSEEAEEHASDVLFSIELRIEDAARNDYLPSKEIWDAADYWLTAFTYEGAADDMGITENTTDAELEEIVEELRTIHSDVVFTDLEEFCQRVREIVQGDE